MQFYEQCPSCQRQAVLIQIHRSFLDKVLRKDFLKFRCAECSAEIFCHRNRKDLRLHKAGADTADV
ncbi:hypothetical protein ACFFLZ_07410 [Photobacterium aphoticum]|uniref:Uncharacterized protein n=1 Tax=Photobacterium aphoticum TaxID=754436 RepID=A0A090QK87_9GAMM|nr:hypothetical protein [Photobacterium aphoticum]KLV01190.1 hypothetical protein ABT58_08625 [Photobacterium aphoticum]PSU56118.1 hypothetical protein C9I90_14015 [Photobacterium aphoticum]GAL02234.1 hypothetical protein JCM19237_5127 [Photobacterium aphoticum]GHA49570.1 hypothetical protein GCM10007086_24230 [Photobacterium aphoticum]